MSSQSSRVRWSRLMRYASPKTFNVLAARWAPRCLIAAALLALVGLGLGLFWAPVDGVQGEVYRIIYLHVPSSWLAMFLYLMMVFWSLIYLVFKTKLSAWFTQAIAPTGALLCVLSLVSGSIWGKPTWGTYWVWDARLTSMLFLLFLYLGYLALSHSLRPGPRAYMATSILVVVGGINLPIIHYSVIWWQTLHQGASLSFSGGNRMAYSMLWPLLIMCVAGWLYAWGMALWRARVIVMQQALQVQQHDWEARSVASLSQTEQP